ncbi:PhzF family phenazine biosynthesis protein [Pseudosulfitobacter pseudonitzschiae]|uniref:PhzF family phenazine biosynthesis protein n=1 Tax=Pseudosulfitobacter pseudonitzschiae TaxID=1402135 RepID=UPI001AF2926B|nr:PhzF family phenazine biosynthesis protein [Pseudosulfitobacter pseudonitzschiae]MBM1814109.1 PhzF family phenazine biosynthesis protein [Pseudosulfitobacter pseudonitzschiae]MBM1831102.1 PhzF family phenazine biosynthesis protein [Pseudosulfitobacter pseudonitzschiae]MBM1835969.1 PhzF family phenazine biosynthesis protein [Pseudosulfitobacter pseudonitzschiae]MBM1840815.1 PhzF family phenazine biosynthesis protein [Pseudosulfitobacter pseudonitzschiae]MBM1845197.1 PhzF family phenazine bio
MTFDFDWVDAFTDRAFGGNGCAVVHQGAGLSVDTCMAYVRETSLVECTFTGPSEVADVRVRYFLASREIPFAGHPTIATVAAMRARGLISDGPLVLETGAGLVPVTVQGTRVSMTQVAPQFGALVDPALVAAVGGVAADDIVSPPQLVSTGLPFVITVLKDRATLEGLQLNPQALADMAATLGGDTDLMEPFWCTLDGFTDAGDTAARLLLAPPSPPEDPFTGSATGAMAAYLWAQGLIERPDFTAEQGHGMGRPGRAQVRVLGPRDAITGVEVAGDGFVLMSGTVDLPNG